MVSEETASADIINVLASASKREHITVGDKVVLWYDRADPQTIDFGDTIRYNMKGVLVGAIFVITGIFFLIMHLQKAKPKKVS